jgi:hypothetical protein
VLMRGSRSRDRSTSCTLYGPRTRNASVSRR